MNAKMLIPASPGLAALLLVVLGTETIPQETAAPSGANIVVRQDEGGADASAPEGASGLRSAEHPSRRATESTAHDPDDRAREEGDASSTAARGALRIEVETDAPAAGVLIVLDDSGRKELEARFKFRAGSAGSNHLDVEGLGPGEKQLVLYQPPFTATRARAVARPEGATVRVSIPERDDSYFVLGGRILDADGWPVQDAEAEVRARVMSGVADSLGGDSLATSGFGFSTELLVGLWG